MRSRLRSLTVPALLACCGLAFAGAPKKPKTLYGLSWHSELPRAFDAARGGAKRAPKPVLWLRMLGDLAGKT